MQILGAFDSISDRHLQVIAPMSARFFTAALMLAMSGGWMACRNSSDGFVPGDSFLPAITRLHCA